MKRIAYLISLFNLHISLFCMDNFSIHEFKKQVDKLSMQQKISYRDQQAAYLNAYSEKMTLQRLQLEKDKLAIVVESISFDMHKNQMQNTRRLINAIRHYEAQNN